MSVAGRWVVVVIIGAALSTAGGAGGASFISQPQAITPASGKRVSTLPYFGWTAVHGADHYEFQLAADSGFNSPVLGSEGHFTTGSTRASIKKTLPNGTYYWRVRAITAGGGVGQWSAARRIVKAWTEAPRQLNPAPGADIAYPQPLILRWRPVTGAASYLVSIATDRTLGSLISSSPLKTTALSLSPSVNLHVGPYYWAVTPVDPEGNKGVQSSVRSFTWAWPSKPGNLQVHDVVGPGDVTDTSFVRPQESALFVPQLSWTPVPGATHYEVEINFDHQWATSSRVCCNDKILGPVFTPTVTLPNNRYYWRVRAFDADGNAGQWVPKGDATDQYSFVKTFDNVCFQELTQNCIPSPPSIQDLRVLDWSGANVTHNGTSSPVVVWDPVPGASRYLVTVTDCSSGTVVATENKSVVAAWTPTFSPPSGTLPLPAPRPAGGNISAGHFKPGVHYCVTVRAAHPSIGSALVYGDATTLPDAFTFLSPSGGTSALGDGDYATPSQQALVQTMPYFTWRPIANAVGYLFVLAKDQSFTNIIDSAYTPVATYSPGAKSYTDETTTYYWAAIPRFKTGWGPFDPLSSARGHFQKHIAPANLHVTQEAPQPTFTWNPVATARNYRLQVAADKNFANIIEEATTDSTSYTAKVTYPPAKVLHWRVRVEDENSVGLSWADSEFPYKLATPSLTGNPLTGDTVPTWGWHPVLGATSYDLHVDLPNGGSRDFTGLRNAAFTAAEIDGTGIFHWQVRANFPSSSGSTHGPYSKRLPFARTIKPPTGAHSIGGPGSLVLLWSPKIGTRQYKLQVATKPDFSATVDSVSTDNPVYAPNFSSSYRKGGIFYWRVAAVDGMGNSGDWSRTRTFRLPPHPSSR